MENTPYLRIGTNYYKLIDQPLASKDINRVILSWSRATIKEDHANDIFPKIPKYDSYCIIPSNMDYQRVHGCNKENGANGSYNLYEPILYKPREGGIEKTLSFLKHIFGDQLEIGLDYMTIIYRQPTQMLPILCLVSIERKTGKTTFLNWLKLIYGANMTLNTDEDFRNNFNSGWASKLIVGGEEISLNRKEDIEKLKNLSTSRVIKSEAKGKDKIECEFFGKFILCSNNEEDFIKIEPDEIRFWIRKIPPINSEIPDYDKDFLSKEIPAFLFFLSKRKIASERNTRMWFTREQLYTDALQKVINKSTSRLEREMTEIIIDELTIFDLIELQLTPKDMVQRLNDNNFRASSTQIIEVFRKWRKEPSEKSVRYNSYSIDQSSGIKEIYKRVGRCYSFQKNEFLK